MRNIIQSLIDDFHERELPDLVARSVPVSPVPHKANVVIGMRRAGKTWFCYQQMQALLAGGLPKERILYLNFEDDRLLPFSVKDFQQILDIYFSKFPSFKNQECFFFLDEIQRIEGWEAFVRRVLDTEHVQLWLTGSSSKLLSTEIADRLRGRSLSIEIFPFAFQEFLLFHGAWPKKRNQWGSRTRASLQHMLGRYMEIGGFPEIQTADAELRRQILRGYVDVVILRDVIERYNASNTNALRYLIRHIISAPGGRFSVNKFYNTLKSNGIACTKNNLYDYLSFLTDAFLFYQSPIHARSERAKQVNPRKIYTIDNSLIQAMTTPDTKDQGARLENLVYMHLRRRGIHPEYYITEQGAEIDFVYFDSSGDEKLRLIQVCWNLTEPKTRQRELQSLRKAMDELNLKNGTIISWMDEESPQDGIEIIPAWKWLLKEII